MRIEKLLEQSEEQEQRQQQLDAFALKVKNELGLQDFDLEANRTGDIRLSLIIVPKNLRGRGVGSQALELLTDYADKLGARLVLGAEDKRKDWGTTSKARLMKFYKRFGFVPKKGRNMDYSMSIYDNMWRRAKK